MLTKSGFESEMRSATVVQFAPGYLEAMAEWVHAWLAHQPTSVDTRWTPVAAEALPDVDDPPWDAHPTIQLGLWVVFLAVFSATCAAPLLRRLLRRSAHASDLDPAVGARRLAVVVSAAHLAVAAGLIGVFVQFAAGEPLPGLWTALRVVALASALMAVGLVAMTMRTWSRAWPPGARLRHTTVTVAAALFVPFLAYWHLLA